MQAQIKCTFISPDADGYARFDIEPLMPKGAALSADNRKLTMIVLYGDAGVEVTRDTIKQAVEKCQDYITGEMDIRPARIEF